jgi:hypothetical protein
MQKQPESAIQKIELPKTFNGTAPGFSNVMQQAGTGNAASLNGLPCRTNQVYFQEWHYQSLFCQEFIISIRSRLTHRI